MNFDILPITLVVFVSSALIAQASQLKFNREAKKRDERDALKLVENLKKYNISPIVAAQLLDGVYDVNSVMAPSKDKGKVTIEKI